MNVQYINPVLQSILNVLKTMAQMEPQVGKPSKKENNTSLGVVTGIMEMTTGGKKGSLAISFSEPVALDIAKRMLREEFTEVNEMVADLTGEITNMVTGGAKAIFQEKGINFDMSLPRVLTGENHIIDHVSGGTTIVLPFTADSGQFYVEICF
jgi:chemotaxis protein CheX